MKEARQRINKILVAGAALALIGGFLLAPYFFAEANFVSEAQDTGVSATIASEDAPKYGFEQAVPISCEFYKYKGKLYCFATDSECGPGKGGDNCFIATGISLPVKDFDLLGTLNVDKATFALGVKLLGMKDATNWYCAADGDCGANQKCVAESGIKNVAITTGNFGTLSVLKETECVDICDPSGKGAGVNCFCDPTNKNSCAVNADCIKQWNQYKDLSGNDIYSCASITCVKEGGACEAQAGGMACCSNLSCVNTGSITAPEYTCQNQGGAYKTCESDMDCLNNMVCGDATIIGDKVYKKCVPEGSLAEGQSCVSNKACASGFCASKDSKTGVGTCSIEGGEAGKVAALNKTSCEKNSGEWVAGAGKDGKGACYAKATPISLSTEIGGKKEVAGLGDYLLTVFNVAMALGAGFAVLMVMVGGFMYMAGGGNPSKLTLAKQYIFGSLSGLILVLFGYLLFNTINPALIKMKPIAMPMVAPQGVKCCKQGLALEFSFGDKCKAGWKEVTAAECQTGITFGGPCCVNKSEPGNNTKCHALGGICFPAEYLSTSGPCTTLAKLTAAATVIAAGGVAVGAEGATAIAKAGWSVTKWGAGKLWTICKANVVGCFTTIVGVTAASEIADVLSALSLSCTQENLGTCMKGGGEPDGTMCSLDEQCMAGSKCLITLPAFACWGGKGVGFCSSGNPGSICKDDEVGGAGLGGCVKASNGKTVYCAAYSSYPGSTSALCSVGAEGQTCWTKDSKDMGICQAGLKCNSKGLCINASVQGTEKVLCSSNADCAADGFCATDNDWTCAYSPGVPGCIKSLWEGVVATGNCYKKVSAGGACITNVQCLSGTCTANKCS